MVISLFQLVVVVVLNIDIVLCKYCVVLGSSMMRWGLLLVTSYFYYVLNGKIVLYETDFFQQSLDGLRIEVIFNLPFYQKTVKLHCFYGTPIYK